MWNRILVKWKLWSEALFGIDDLQENQLAGLERRVSRLEHEMERLWDPQPQAIQPTSSESFPWTKYHHKI